MHMRPCWVEINLAALEHNFRFLATLADSAVDLLAIVKSDAYGHGLSLCAPAAVSAGSRWLGVTSVEEGIEARHACPEARILIISGAFPGQGSAVIRHDLTPIVWDSWQFDELESAVREAGTPSLPVHIEIDTGMSRQGVALDSLATVLARIRQSPFLHLEGVMTHLFAADESDGEVTRDQLDKLESALSHIREAGISPAILNVGNSAALLAGNSANIAAIADRYRMRALMRPGLALYGLVPEFDPNFPSAEPASLAQARAHLRPVLTWKTQVVSVRSVSAGSVVGYNGTFVATEHMRLALIAAGYADGLDRKLGNHFSLLVRGQRAPLVGRISMDQSVIDVTDIPGVAPGDEVVLIGRQGDDSISAFDHAKAANTIPWEIFTRISARVPRITV